jgi:hypothetical protein
VARLSGAKRQRVRPLNSVVSCHGKRYLMSKSRELPIPSESEIDAGASEIVRVWVGETVSVVLDDTIWKDPAAWGILLVDLAKHVAAAHASRGTTSDVEAMARIREAFDVEWNHATSVVAGRFLGKHDS